MRFKLPKVKLKVGVIALIVLVVLAAAIVFTISQQQAKVVQEIVINIDTQDENYFIDEKEVNTLMSDRGKEELEGMQLSKINLKVLEERIKRNTFAHEVQVYKDLKGVIYADIKQCRPIARVIHKDSDFYVSDKGTLLPMSDQFTARVPVITGVHTGKLLVEDFANDSITKPYFEILKLLDRDKFLKALVAELDINSKGEITIYPQIGKQTFDFGFPESLENKFNKLKLFYTKIVPVKGWNRYERVSLKYDNQIITE